jgi:DNA-binding CsgD family transcriptional regulator/tetratricopeptide (TPR) repeat protein
MGQVAAADLSQITGALLERDEALLALVDSLVPVQQWSQGRVVLVSGEAGVGKTALLRRFCDAHSTSVRILWGACTPLLTPSPLAPFVEFAGSCAPNFEEVLERGATPHEISLALVRELRRKEPTILVLEDVHWADDATLDVVRLLARSHSTVSALVLMSYRDTELGRFHPLRRALGEMGSSESIRRLRLAPLSLEAVRALATPDFAEPEELYRRTGGNPFFVTEVLASGEEIPATVRDAVLARAARLTAAGWTLLEAVALSPTQAELWLLEAIVPAALGTLDECLAAGMLTSDGGSVRFRHELARLAIEEASAPDRVVVLHRAALRALEASASSDAARLSHHAEAAGDHDAVLRYAPAAAARAASVGAHREAAAQYARALRFAETSPPEKCAELWSRRSFECFLTTQDAHAEAASELAIAKYRELGDRRREGDALRWLALVQHNTGRAPDGIRVANRALSLLEQLPPGRELGMAYSALAGITLLSENREQSRDWAAKAIEVARRLEDNEVYISALGGLGASEALRGEAEGRRKLEQTLSLATEDGLDNQIGRTYVFLGMAACRERSLDKMAARVYPGLAFCEERDLAVWGRILLAMQSWLELQRGAWDQAAETTSLVLSQRCALSSLQARIVLGLLRARRGDPDPWTPLEEADRVAQGTTQLWWTSQVAAAQAEVAWLEGRPEKIAPATEEAFRLALRLESPWPAGELAVWRRRAGVEEQVPGQTAVPYALQLAGDWTAAAEAWRRSGCTYEAALALAEADDDRALRQALDELHALGARPAAAIVARRLRERGARGLPRGPRRSTRESPAGLTKRELEVLALVADGLRNGEIAERLFLSPKTVDHHVSAILRKLSVRTRAEASSEAVRLGLATVSPAPKSR